MSAVIESLIAVGVREGIDEALHYGTKGTHMALHLGKSGKVLKVEHKTDSPVRVPWPVSRTNDVNPNLLFDSVKYVGGENAKRWEASARLHQGWCEGAPDHPAVTAVERFFAKGPPKLDLSSKERSLDLIFYFEGKPVCEHEELYESIRTLLRDRHTFVDRPSRFDEGDQCVTDTHGKVSLYGLDNAQALLGYNANVTWNAEHTKSARMLHCPLSYEAMRNLTGGLTWLRDNRLLPAVACVGTQILWLGWTVEHHRIEDVVKAVVRGCPKGTKVEEHRKWVHEHLDADTDLFDDPTPYHVLVLGCDYRIAVRGFHTLTVAQVARALVAYLDDFSWPTKDGPLRTMMPPYAVLNMGKPKIKLTAGLVQAFGDALFLGAPYPRPIEEAAIDAYVSSSTSHEEGRASIPSQAAVRAVTRRRSGASNQGTDMTTTANIHPDILNHPFFIAGRIFSVLETRNWRAKDKADAVRVSRSLSRAVRNPERVILSELCLLSEKHVRKLRSRKHRTYSQEVQDLFEQMNEALTARGQSEWPKRGSTTDRGFFIRGRMYQEKLERDRRAADIEGAPQDQEKNDTESPEETLPPEGV